MGRDGIGFQSLWEGASAVRQHGDATTLPSSMPRRQARRERTGISSDVWFSRSGCFLAVQERARFIITAGLETICEEVCAFNLTALTRNLKMLQGGVERMLLQTSQGQSGSAHVVVLGNEKGGSGKSTTALHIAVALLKAGQRVATIDLDCRQQSFTRYINNRRAWASRTGLDLELPVHRCIKLGQTMQIAENELTEFEQFEESVRAVEHCFDFVVIDTPGSDSYLMRLAHSMADTLVTPINDSFLDFDVLGTVDPETYSVTGESHYAEMVRDTRRKRRQIDGVSTDWIVVRNRLSMLGSRNKQLVADGLNELSLRLGFRSVDGFAERVVYREFFPRGLTALDDLDEETLGTRPNLGHVTAREEVTSLLRQLKLPLDERGRRRAANRAEWFNQVDKPLELHDIIGA
jgi:chromosome partitioning protein